MGELRFKVLMVDDHIRMSMSELNDEYFLPPVTQLRYDEYEEGPGDYGPPEYPSYDEDVSNTDDFIPSQDNNRLGGKILAMWERCKPLLQHDYSRTGYMLSVDAKNMHMQRLVSCIYMSIIISYSYYLSFLKKSKFVLYTCRITTPMKITWQWSK